MMNKKTLEALTHAGALDGLRDRHGKAVNRARYLAPVPNDPEQMVLEQALRYGQRVHEERNSPQASLFGEATGAQAVTEPEIPWCEPASVIESLKKEREVIGFFLSGHPLDEHRMAIKRFANTTLDKLDDFRDQEVKIAGIITSVQERTTRAGGRFMICRLEDFSGGIEIALFNDDYTKFAASIQLDSCLYLEGKYEPDFRNPDQYVLRRLKMIRFLETLVEEKTQEVLIQLKLADIDGHLIDEINRLLLNFTGSCKVSFLVEDVEQQYQQRFRSSVLQVAPHADLFSQLNQMNLSYSLK